MVGDTPQRKGSGGTELGIGCGCLLAVIGVLWLAATLVAPVVGVPVFVAFVLLWLLLK